jgi:hypothetical protein
MKICEAGHPKLICEDECPVCALDERRQKEIALLQEKITQLEATMDHLSARIEDYRKELGL